MTVPGRVDSFPSSRLEFCLEPRPTAASARPDYLDAMAETYLRRSTMQAAQDPYGNARAGIPVPSTIKKVGSGSGAGRMSMAGPALRPPYLAGAPTPGTNPRHSFMRSQNANPMPPSASKPGAFGRTPLHKYVQLFDRTMR